jgi:hypothetical protein
MKSENAADDAALCRHTRNSDKDELPAAFAAALMPSNERGSNLSVLAGPVQMWIRLRLPVPA